MDDNREPGRPDIAGADGTTAEDDPGQAGWAAPPGCGGAHHAGHHRTTLATAILDAAATRRDYLDETGAAAHPSLAPLLPMAHPATGAR